MFSYILNPFYFLESSQMSSLKEKVVALIKTYLFYFLLVIGSAILLIIIDSCIVHLFHLPSIAETMNKNNANEVASFGKSAFIVLVIITPLLEELIFRLPLNLKKENVALASALFVFLMLGGRISIMHGDLFQVLINLIASITVFFLLKQYLSEAFLERCKTAYFKYIFYGSAAIFGLLHILNFATSDYRLWIFYPFFILPQFITGLLAGNLRMKYGFIWAWFLHALVNTPAVLNFFFK